MKKSLFLFLTGYIFLAIVSNLYSQTEVKDEYEELKKKADQLWEERKFYESADQYLKMVEFQKALPNPDLKKISSAYGDAGYCYDELGKYDKAIELYIIAIDYGLKASDSANLGTLYSNIAQSYVQVGKYDDAIINLNLSLGYDRAINNEDGIATNLNAIGKVYELWGKYEDAINYFSQALEINRKKGDQAKVAIRLSSLASVYKALGKYDKALEYQNEALSIDIKMKNGFKIAVRYDQIGEIYQYKKDFDKAEKYFLLALNQLNEVEKLKDSKVDKRTLPSHAIILNHLGKNFLLKGNTEKAKEYLLKGLKIAEQAQHNTVMTKSYRELSDVFKKEGNYKSAYEYFIRYHNRKDSAFNAESQKIISEFREKYETEKKEKEIAVLTSEKELSQLNLEKTIQQRTYTVILLILFALLSLIAYSRYRFKKQANQILADKNTELESLNAAKNRFFAIISHDLKSPITSFQKITGSLNRSLDDIDKETLKEFIRDMNDTAVSLNDFLKKLLQWAMSQSGRLKPQKSVFSINEICESTSEFLKHFADENSVTIEKNCGPDIKIFADKEMIETALRNLLTNAVKFSDKGKAVKIEITQKNSSAKVSVTNVGPGIKAEDAAKLFHIDTNHTKIGNHPAKGSGLGLILTKELIMMNEGSVFVDSIKPEATTFSFELPVYVNN